MIIRLARGDLTADYRCPVPVKDNRPGGNCKIIGNVVRVWFDGEYTMGEIEGEVPEMDFLKRVVFQYEEEKEENRGR